MPSTHTTTPAPLMSGPCLWRGCWWENTLGDPQSTAGPLPRTEGTYTSMTAALTMFINPPFTLCLTNPRSTPSTCCSIGNTVPDLCQHREYRGARVRAQTRPRAVRPPHLLASPVHHFTKALIQLTPPRTNKQRQQRRNPA